MQTSQIKCPCRVTEECIAWKTGVMLNAMMPGLSRRAGIINAVSMQEIQLEDFSFFLQGKKEIFTLV